MPRSIALRRRKNIPHRKWVASSVSYRGEAYVVMVHHDALRDLTDDDTLSATAVFDQNVRTILEDARELLDAGKLEQDGYIHIRRARQPASGGEG